MCLVIYDIAYHRQIARQLEQLHKWALKSVIQGEKKELGELY